MAVEFTLSGNGVWEERPLTWDAYVYTGMSRPLCITKGTRVDEVIGF